MPDGDTILPQLHRTSMSSLKSEAARDIDDADTGASPEQMLAGVKLEDPAASLDNLFAGSDSDEHIIKTEPSQTEDLGGDVALKSDEDGQPILARTAKVKGFKHEPLLYPTDEYPSARLEAALAFQELEYCTYQSRDIGETGQEEMMSCDCKADIGKFDYRFNPGLLILERSGG